MCQIANALLELKNAGHARYITWSYSFHCECNDLYNVLDNQAMKMERELKQWNKEITMSRSSCHILNLFTTQQLRVIRQQLGQLNCERISSLPPAVLSMLMSISPKICEKDVKECLQLVKTESSLVGQHSSKKLENLDNSSDPVDHDDNMQISQFNPDNEISKEAAVEKLVMQLINQLNDVERKAYEELKEDYSDKLAYLSIKSCSNANIEQEALVTDACSWCLDNEDKYNDPEVVLNELQAVNMQSNEFVANEQSTQCENDEKFVVQSQNDRVYLMEQMLIENYIPSGLAREVAELFPNDIEEALDYCLNEENKSNDQSLLQLPSADSR